MTKVFISYSRKDKPFAETFTTSLNQSEMETWIDWESIPATADWLDQIHQGIEGSDGFLFLLSPDSIASQVCLQEVEHAVKNGKRLIPIVIRDIPADKVHPALAKVNWIYCREQDDFERAVKTTLEAIRTDLAWVEFHRRLQVRALEWEKRADSSLLLRGGDLRLAEEQLASVGQKDPRPTDLQRQYTLASRRRESNTRNLLLAIGAVIMVALSLLSVFANTQRILARNNENTAIANQDIASTEKVNAEHQGATAVANSQLALARQFAAQSQLLAAGSAAQRVQSALLAIESLRRTPTLEGEQALKQSWVQFPQLVQSMQPGGEVEKVLFSPDGRFLVSATGAAALVWDISSGSKITEMEHDDLVDSLALSPGGRLVASAAGNVILVWEALTGRKMLTLEHEDEVNSLAFSPNGKRIVSASVDGTARVWEVATGNEISHIQHEGIVWDAAFSPDGKYIASAGNDTAWVWEAATGQPVSQITPPRRMFKVVFSPNGQYVASGGEETARVWVATTGEEVAQINQPGHVLAIAFSQDGSWVASGSTDGTWQVWASGTGKLLARGVHDWSPGIDSFAGSVYSLVFSPDGTLLLTGSHDGTGRIWELQTGEEILRLAPDVYYAPEDAIDSRVNTVAFSPDGTLAAIGNEDGWIGIWRNQSDAALIRSEINYEPSSKIAFNTDGTQIAYRGDDQAVHIWDVNTNRELIRLPVLEIGEQLPPFNSDDQVMFSSDGKRLIHSSLNDLVQIWNVDTGQEIAAIHSYSDVAISSDGDWLALHGNDHSLQIWQTDTGREIKRIPLQEAGAILALSRDGKMVAVGSTEPSEVRLWEIASGEEISSFETSGFLTQLAFSDAQDLIASGSEDGSIQVWEAKSAKPVMSIKHDGIVYSIAFSPDGRYLAAASGEYFSFGMVDENGRALSTHGTLSILDTVTRTETVQISFNQEVQDVLFSPDGKWLLSLDGNNTLRLWHVLTGTENSRITVDGIFEYISALNFSPSGNMIVTAGGAELKQWLWRPEDLIDGLCNRLPRNLSRAEWRLFMGNEPYRATCEHLPLEPEFDLTPTLSP